MDLKIGKFVKFTDRDSQGRYEHVGELISITPKWISFDTGGTIFTIPVSEADKLSKASKPAGWDPDLVDREIPAKKTAAGKKRPKTKREMVAELVSKNYKASRAEQIQLCVEELSLSEGCASTYVSLARKSLRSR